MTPQIDEIKDAIRQCRTVAEVNAAAKRYGQQVKELEGQGGDMQVMAIQIRNLAQYRRVTVGR